jgi:hypothetical protein
VEAATGFRALGATRHLDLEHVVFRDCQGGSGVIAESTCTGLQWWHCAFLNNGRPPSAGGVHDHKLCLRSADCVLADSLVARNSRCGVVLDGGVGAFVLNNSVVDNGVRTADPQASAGILGDGAARADRVLNNVIAFNTGCGAAARARAALRATRWIGTGVAESETFEVDPRSTDRRRGHRGAKDAVSPAIDAALASYASDFAQLGAAPACRVRHHGLADSRIRRSTLPRAR